MDYLCVDEHKKNDYNMKRKLFLIPIVALLALGSCAPKQPWTAEEAKLINSAAYSRMRVTQIDATADSLLLRNVCAPLTREHLATPEFGRLVASMLETVNDPYHGGVGIAAPQVGVLRRMVAVQRYDKAGRPFEIYVNPVITSYGEDKALGGEGCLSVPDLRGEVERSQTIEIEWRDPVSFELRSERIEGFTAVIFQHEIDHLDGILYIDRAARLVEK